MSLVTVFLMPLKTIINVFKIDLESILMDPYQWKIDSRRWDYRWKIYADPWELNPGSNYMTNQRHQTRAAIKLSDHTKFLTVAQTPQVNKYPIPVKTDLYSLYFCPPKIKCIFFEINVSLPNLNHFQLVLLTHCLSCCFKL